MNETKPTADLAVSREMGTDAIRVGPANFCITGDRAGSPVIESNMTDS